MNTYKPNSIVNMRKALSLSVAALLILTTIVTTIPVAFATASTTSVSPNAATAKSGTDLTFTIANPSTSTASYSQVQIRVTARWALLTADGVTVTGLGGTPSVSISGTGPYVVVISGVSLAPGASGTVKLAGMVADVGAAGASYTDQFTVFSLDATSGAILVADTNNAAAALQVAVTVSTTTATRMDLGMTPTATYATTTLSSAENIHVNVTTAAGALTATTVAAPVTIIVAGRDSSGNSLIGRANVQAAATPNSKWGVKLLDDSTAASFKSIDSVWIKATGSIPSDTFKIVSNTSATAMVTGIATTDSVAGSLVAGQSINVAAFVTDNTGKGVSSVTVAFADIASTTTEKTGGTFAADSVTTDSLGVARTTFTTDTSRGTTTIRATSAGLLGSLNTFKITTVWGTAVALTVAASPTSVTAVSGSTTVTAKLVDSNGNTRQVAGVTVNFGTTGGTLSATSATTAATGIATVTLSATSTTAAGSTATITANAAGLTGSATVSFTSGPVASVTLALSSTSLKIQESVTATATVKDANGNLINGATVTFTQTTVSGLATYAPTLSPASAITGATGTASATLTASIQSGTLTITASTGGFTATSGTITINGGAATKLTGPTATLVIAADGTSTTSITFTLQDAYSNTVLPSASIALTITTTGGTFTSTGTATATDSISTTTGMSSGVTLKSTTTVGSVTVTATGGGLTGSKTVTFAGAATNFKLSAKPSIVQVSTASTITAQLIDGAGNNALAGTTAPTITTLSSTAGTVAIATALAASGTSGTFTYTAPATVPAGGAATITIGIQLTGTTGTFIVQQQLAIQISGAAFTLTLSADPTSAPADGTTLVTVTAKLVDVSGVTIITSPGTAIQFSTTSGTFLTSTVTTSTSTGIATAYLKAPSTAGLATLTAVGGGVSGSLTYNFTTPGTVYTETIAAPAVKDTAGNVVSAPTVGTVVTVASTIANTKTTAQPTVYIVQVKDSKGAVVSLSFMSVSIPASTSLELGVGWTPTAAGTYTIQVFAWDSWTTANPQAATQTITVTVA